jgi:hypothetical protein
MFARQFSHSAGTLPAVDQLRAALDGCQVLIVFAAVDWFGHGGLAKRLREACPQAEIIGCSTAGELTADGMADGSLVITGIHFEHTRARVASFEFGHAADSVAAGRQLAHRLGEEKPTAVFVLGPGVDINGTALLAGLRETLGAEVPISGGLAGDAGRFERSWVVTREGESSRRVAALALYGQRLIAGYGSVGGWRPFGPRRRVTRAEGNVLFELDGQPALDLYKRYLGEHAGALPASGLLFPFAMVRENGDGGGEAAPELIRTILGIDAARGALILAGDVSDATHLQLMHASTDALVDGAHSAAENAFALHGGQRRPDVALLVSCVGRKLVMGGRTDEEIEAVAHVLGDRVPLAGFYSNGEIAPGVTGVGCELHNQTMTVTLWGEA